MAAEPIFILAVILVLVSSCFGSVSGITYTSVKVPQPPIIAPGIHAKEHKIPVGKPAESTTNNPSSGPSFHTSTEPSSSPNTEPSLVVTKVPSLSNSHANEENGSVSVNSLLTIATHVPLGSLNDVVTGQPTFVLNENNGNQALVPETTALTTMLPTDAPFYDSTTSLTDQLMNVQTDTPTIRSMSSPSSRPNKSPVTSSPSISIMPSNYPTDTLNSTPTSYQAAIQSNSPTIEPSSSAFISSNAYPSRENAIESNETQSWHHISNSSLNYWMVNSTDVNEKHSGSDWALSYHLLKYGLMSASIGLVLSSLMMIVMIRKRAIRRKITEERQLTVTVDSSATEKLEVGHCKVLVF